jgi:hypothetical protein
VGDVLGALGVWLPVLVFLVLLTWSSGVWPLVVFVSVPTIALAPTVTVRRPGSHVDADVGDRHRHDRVPVRAGAAVVDPA